MTPNNDTPDTGASDAADNAAAYPYSLRNRKYKKNNMTPNIYAPNDDTPDAANNDDVLNM